MRESDTSGLFENPGEQIRSIRDRMDQVRAELETASPERRSELGWWMFGARKWMGRLADVNLARRFGEHRFMIHEVVDDVVFAVCSCGVRFPGVMHETWSLAEFPTLPGHREFGHRHDNGEDQ